MSKTSHIICLAILLVLAYGQDLPVVDKVDIEKFSGIWYEIARLDYDGEKGCICSQQLIERANPIEFVVNNTCHLLKPDGPMLLAPMKMTPLADNNTKLRMEDQTEIWIIALADDYSWNMVARPDRQHLWINSRSLRLDQNTINTLKSKAKSLNFPIEKLVMDRQICGSNFMSTIM